MSATRATAARTTVAAVLLAAGFLWGTFRILGFQYAAGDFYPQYSSLRSDPGGSKLLYDALGRMRGVTVERNYLPLEYLNGNPGAVLLLGLHVAAVDRDLLQNAENLAGRGGRVVIAMAFEGETLPEHSPLEDVWHVHPAIHNEPRAAHPLTFAKADGWEILDRDDSGTLAVERAFGSGYVLLFSESGHFGNAYLISGDGHLEQISAALGPDTRVIFDEAHLGIAESGSVVGLIRRFRLTGLVLGFAIVLVLLLWKNTAAFPPPEETRLGQRAAGRTSFEGLLGLLQQHVRTKDLVQTCWAEWLKVNRREVSPDRWAQAEAIAASASANPVQVNLLQAHLVQSMREIQTGLRAKGEL